MCRAERRWLGGNGTFIRLRIVRTVTVVTNRSLMLLGSEFHPLAFYGSKIVQLFPLVTKRKLETLADILQDLKQGLKCWTCCDIFIHVKVTFICHFY